MTCDWHPYPKEKPTKDGVYITTVYIPGATKNVIRICSYSHDLHSVDSYDFKKGAGPGFYNYDSEYGYYSEINVIAWDYKPEPYKGQLDV